MAELESGIERLESRIEQKESELQAFRDEPEAKIDERVSELSEAIKQTDPRPPKNGGNRSMHDHLVKLRAGIKHDSDAWVNWRIKQLESKLNEYKNGTGDETSVYTFISEHSDSVPSEAGPSQIRRDYYCDWNEDSDDISSVIWYDYSDEESHLRGIWMWVREDLRGGELVYEHVRDRMREHNADTFEAVVESENLRTHYATIGFDTDDEREVIMLAY